MRDAKLEEVPYWVERESILAMLQQAKERLERLRKRPDHVEGSPPQGALDGIADAIGDLTPDEYDGTSNGRQHPNYQRREELLRAAQAAIDCALAAEQEPAVARKAPRLRLVGRDGEQP